MARNYDEETGVFASFLMARNYDEETGVFAVFPIASHGAERASASAVLSLQRQWTPRSWSGQSGLRARSMGRKSFSGSEMRSMCTAPAGTRALSHGEEL